MSILVPLQVSTRPRVMGILNVTPDSFSDGGQWNSFDLAIHHAHYMMAGGADLIDVGGESTRPGSASVTPAEERARILDIVTQLVRDGIPVSVDTMHASTAVACLNAGATLINDVSGGVADPDMLRVVADAGAPYCLMHWRTQDFNAATVTNPDSTDIVADVCADLRPRIDAALAAGIDPAALILDPGVGFSTSRDQDWQLLQGIPRLQELGFPLLIGASRKRIFPDLLRSTTPPLAGESYVSADGDLPTAVLSALVATQGVWAVRVHDVRATATALAVQAAWQEGRNPSRADTEPSPQASAATSSEEHS